MKFFLTLILSCLGIISIYGQEAATTDGVFFFEKAELRISNYNTKEEVEHKIVTDTATIKQREDFHLTNVYLEVKIQSGEIIETVMPDGQRYTVDITILKPEISEEKKMMMNDNLSPEMMAILMTDQYQYTDHDLKVHERKMEGDKLIFSYPKYTFGQTGIGYTMEAELTVTMTKQHD